MAGLVPAIHDFLSTARVDLGTAHALAWPAGRVVLLKKE
jgi:hypothetical protein